MRQATNAENNTMVSRVLRVIVTSLSFCFFYTKAAGTLLNAMVYLVDHHWYLLAITCAIVVLGISFSILAVYQWMWRWQEWVLLSTNPTYHRVVTLDDEDETWPALAKTMGWKALFVLMWALFCWANVRLDYLVFWSQYADAHPQYNIELIFVNCLQAGPILAGAAFALYYIYPAFYQRPMTPTYDLEETNTQGLLS